MHDEVKFLRWLELPDNSPIQFQQLPVLLALVIEPPPMPDDPDDDANDLFGTTVWNFEIDLKQAALEGRLKVRSPSTGFFLKPPFGNALAKADILPVQDLRPFLAEIGIGLRIGTEEQHVQDELRKDAKRQSAAEKGERQARAAELAAIQKAKDELAAAQRAEEDRKAAPERQRLVEEATGTTLPAENVATAAGSIFAKRALIEKYQSTWPSIAADLANSNKNGLSAAAKVEPRGWRELAACDWARTHGKLLGAPSAAAELSTVMRDLPSRMYRMDG